MPMEPRLDRAVKRLGATFEGTGIPRMPARVFAYVLAEDGDAYTARELAAGLEVSPAAISGAMRYLTDARLVLRERSPAGRGDVFRIVDGDVWSTILEARLPTMDFFVAGVDEAMAALPADSAGRARLQETRDFFAFVGAEFQGMLERWRAAR